jgi:hypothetical protein
MQSFKDNRQVADVEGISISMRCWKCEGSLRAERAIDLKPGVSNPCVRMRQLEFAQNRGIR